MAIFATIIGCDGQPFSFNPEHIVRLTVRRSSWLPESAPTEKDTEPCWAVTVHCSDGKSEYIHAKAPSVKYFYFQLGLDWTQSLNP